jgi:hypothetical protein
VKAASALLALWLGACGDAAVDRNVLAAKDAAAADKRELAPHSAGGGPRPLTPARAIDFLRLDAEETQTSGAVWNGKQTVFADYLVGDPGKAERHLVLVQESPGAGPNAVSITVGEVEGGQAEVAAVGFANADGDEATELIVVLRWQIRHYDVSGSLYEVRLFDDVKPGRASLASLADISKKFDVECECERRDDTPEHARFQTVAAVKQELARLGY